jgi:hypothetical protein
MDQKKIAGPGYRLTEEDYKEIQDEQGKQVFFVSGKLKSYEKMVKEDAEKSAIAIYGYRKAVNINCEGKIDVQMYLCGKFYDVDCEVIYKDGYSEYKLKAHGNELPDTLTLRTWDLNNIIISNEMKKQIDLNATFNSKQNESKHISYNILGTIGTPRTTHNYPGPLYIKHHPLYKDGIVCYNTKLEAYWGKDGKPVVDCVVTSYAEIVPNIGSRAWSVCKRGDVPCAVDEVLYNKKRSAFSLHQVYCEDVDYDGETDRYASGFFVKKFISAYPEFCDHSGLFLGIMLTRHDIDDVVKYLYAFAKYPVLEQLVKMGNWAFVKSLIDVCGFAASSASAKNTLARLNELLNKTTEGKKAICLPTYIVNNLRSNSAPVEKYIVWKDMYELTHMSKEQYEALIWSTEYNLVSCCCVRLENSLVDGAKYGYEPLKLLRYVVKQAQYLGVQFSNVFTLLLDYQNMCDILQATADMYPKDIREVHDKTMAAFKAYENKEKDAVIESLAAPLQLEADKVAEEFNASEKKTQNEGGEFEEYTIVIPKGVRDLVDEGGQQNNCVGSYVEDVASEKSIVFFIRKAESPEKSLITAEFRNGGLRQCFFKNNMPVSMDDAGKRLAGKFCERLSKVFEPGKPLRKAG